MLVLGTGVAGLQAIGTARRLGAVVSAYDVRPETRTEVESLGGTFIELKSVESAAGTGGYARALTEEERQAQQDELAGHIAAHDVVITTAQVPGRRPPLLITADALKGMAAGSVIVDMGASDLGGNVADSRPGETVVTENGVTVIGAASLPSTMPTAASAMYARNVSSLLQYLVKDGALAIDRDDDLQAGVLITHDGQVVHPAVMAVAALIPADPAGGSCTMSTALLTDLTIFVLSLWVGFEVISKVPATLHTPLMSAANSIHGIVLAGAMLIAVTADNAVGYVIAFVAAAFAAMNVVGGYAVTGRMLKMFKKRPTAPAPPAGAAPSAARPRRTAAPPGGRRERLHLDHPAGLRAGRVGLRARPAPDEQSGHRAAR